MTKLALVMVARDNELIKIDAKPILAVHDEIILEVPAEYADFAKERLEMHMLNAAKIMVKNIPFKVEGEILDRWYKD